MNGDLDHHPAGLMADFLLLFAGGAISHLESFFI